MAQRGNGRVVHVVVSHVAAQEGIDRELVDEVIDLLDAKGVNAASCSIDLWLNSPGGDAHAAYKLCLELRHRSTHLRGIVVDVAKSAATLIMVAMDELMMGPCAELGPLDVQIEHPDREGMIVSGLDVTRSLEHLAQAAIGIALRGGASFLHATKLPRATVLHELLKFSADFMGPVVSKLDPHLIHRSMNELRVAELYAQRLLETRRKHTGPLDVKDNAKLIWSLVNVYPSHSFVIGRDEAARMGLPVRPAEKHPRWLQIRELIRLSESEEERVVVVLDDTELDSDSDEVQIENNEPERTNLAEAPS